MLSHLALPFRFVRAARYGLIASGALISGLGLWMQIKGIPSGGEALVGGLRDLVSLALDGPVTIFGVFSKIGGVLALLGLLGMTVHDIAPAKSAATDDPTPDHKPEVVGTVGPAMSTWQERLAAKAEPQQREQTPKSAVSALRFGLVGLVLCAFLAALAATFLGSSAGQVPVVADASAPGHAMIRAHLAAAGVVSDTAPAAPSALAALSIPKFDPTTIVPWVKVQLTKALAGDQAAMITLGSIFGGIFVLLLGTKIMFAVRRDKATQRTSTRRVSYS